jgi:hypothetical protein
MPGRSTSSCTTSLARFERDAARQIGQGRVGGQLHDAAERNAGVSPPIQDGEPERHALARARGAGQQQQEPRREGRLDVDGRRILEQRVRPVAVAVDPDPEPRTVLGVPVHRGERVSRAVDDADPLALA